MTDIEIIELFNETKEELIEFSDSLKSERLVSIKIDANGMAKTEKLPDEKSLRAALLLIRMFIQKNDAISFYKMSKLYSRINVPQDLKDKFTQLRNALNNYFDKSSNFSISDTSLVYGTSEILESLESESGQKQFTNREFMKIYIDGHYAHYDKSKRKDL